MTKRIVSDQPKPPYNAAAGKASEKSAKTGRLRSLRMAKEAADKSNK